MTFKERLREEIDYKGVLIKEIAAEIGISNSTFLSYINSRSVMPNVETAVKIAKALNVSVEYLVTGETSTFQTSNDNKIKSITSKLKHFSEKDLSIINSVVDGLDEKYS